MLAGVVAIAFGIARIAFPAAGALALVWMIGAYALFIRFVHVILGLGTRAAMPSPA